MRGAKERKKFSLREDLKLFKPKEFDIFLILLLSVAQTFPVYRNLINLMWNGAMSYTNGLIWMLIVMIVAMLGAYLLVCVAIPLIKLSIRTLRGKR